MGFRSPDGRYIPGIMREPYEHGGVLCLDEIDNSNPSVLTSLNAALDGKWASFPDGMVPRHKDFVVVAGANTFGRGADRVYVGRMQLDGATLNRFGFVEWNYDEDAEVDWAGHDQVEWVLWVQKIRHKLQELRIRHIVGPRNSIKGAALLRNGVSWEDVAEAWVWQGLPEEDRERVAM
jgi:MoxR-like ATPase